MGVQSYSKRKLKSLQQKVPFVHQKIVQKLKQIKLRKNVMALFLACSLFFRTYDAVHANSSGVSSNSNTAVVSSSTTSKQVVATKEYNVFSSRMEQFAAHKKKSADVSDFTFRGGGNSAAAMKTTPKEEVQSALSDLSKYMGPKKDILVLLAATALIPSICVNVLKISPILGFLAAGRLQFPIYIFSIVHVSFPFWTNLLEVFLKYAIIEINSVIEKNLLLLIGPLVTN